MPAQWNLGWIAALVVAALLLALPAAAQATLVFTRKPFDPVVWVANDNGFGARSVAKGYGPRISPDGSTIAFFRSRESNSYLPELMVATADGSGTPRRLLVASREPFLEWSPDSSTLAMVFGSDFGSKRLVAIDLANNAVRTLARGYFSGVSFAPEGGQIAYSRSGREAFPPRSDVFTVSLASGKSTRLTRDHRSLSPLWGPGGTIVFSKLVGHRPRRYGPRGDLFLINAGGGRVRRLTHTKVDPLLFGLTPTEWSANGSRLLTEFGGQDTSYAVTVNPRTGAERALTKERETGFVGSALSADGSTVLGYLGGFDPSNRHKVVTIPYAGGRPKLLAANASEPDWNR